MKNNFDKAVKSMTKFILGEKEESLSDLKRKTTGFTLEPKTVRKKRKYTKRKVKK